MPRKHFHCFSSLQEKQGRQAHAYLQADEPESCVWIITWDCFSFTGWLTGAASGLLIQPWSSALAEGNGCIALKILKQAKRGWAVSWKLMNYINFFQMKSISDRQEWQRVCKKKKKVNCCQRPCIPHWFSILGPTYDQFSVPLASAVQKKKTQKNVSSLDESLYSHLKEARSLNPDHHFYCYSILPKLEHGA